MADYIFIRKSRNALSSFLHVLMNISLGVGSILITIISGSWILGFLLVFLSKWRIFAVRPRFWFLNIKSNLVDLIVGSSFVFIAYFAGTEILPVHFVLAAFYTAWLIFVKPRTSKTATIFQALCAVLFGTTAAVLTLSSFNSIFLILAEFIIGYGASRHLFVQIGDKNFTHLSITCGLLCAETTWLLYSWSILYTFGNTGIIIPQLSLVLTISAFSFSKIFQSTLRHDGKLKFSEIVTPALFGILTIAIIIFGFSNPIFNI